MWSCVVNGCQDDNHHTIIWYAPSFLISLQIITAEDDNRKKDLDDEETIDGGEREKCEYHYQFRETKNYWGEGCHIGYYWKIIDICINYVFRYGRIATMCERQD